MGKLDRLMLLIYGGLVVLAGALLFAVQFGYLEYHQLQEFSQNYVSFAKLERFQKFWGLVIALLGVSLLNIAFSRRDRQRAISFKTEKGDVRIVLAAIEEYIKRSTGEMPELKDLKTEVYARRKTLKVFTKLVLRSDVNVTDIAGQVQADIEDRVLTMLGMQIPIQVHVNVVKMTSDYEAEELEEEEEEYEEEEVEEEEVDEEEAFEGIRY